MLYNSRGISVHAFGFGWAENLSAQHMGLLGATLRQVLTRARMGGWRCHSDVTIVKDETEWQGAGDVPHRKRTEVCVRIWRKLESRVLDTKREGSTFVSSQAWGELAPYEGCTRWGAKWIRQHRKLCLSSLGRNL